jgi:hypothetical protein
MIKNTAKKYANDHSAGALRRFTHRHNHRHSVQVKDGCYLLTLYIIIVIIVVLIVLSLI